MIFDQKSCNCPRVTVYRCQALEYHVSLRPGSTTRETSYKFLLIVHRNQPLCAPKCLTRCTTLDDKITASLRLYKRFCLLLIQNFLSTSLTYLSISPLEREEHHYYIKLNLFAAQILPHRLHHLLLLRGYALEYEYITIIMVNALLAIPKIRINSSILESIPHVER